MAVLDITIPTGYWIQQQKLDAYVLSNRVRNLRRAKYFNQKVIFYFDYVRVAPSTGQLEGVVALTRIICVFFGLFFFSWIKRISVLILPLNVGIRWPICPDICQFVFMIIMLQVNFYFISLLLWCCLNSLLLSFGFCLLQNVLMKLYLTRCPRISWISVRFVAAHSVLIVRSTILRILFNHPRSWMWLQSVCAFIWHDIYQFGVRRTQKGGK